MYIVFSSTEAFLAAYANTLHQAPKNKNKPKGSLMRYNGKHGSPLGRREFDHGCLALLT